METGRGWGLRSLNSLPGDNGKVPVEGGADFCHVVTNDSPADLPKGNQSALPHLSEPTKGWPVAFDGEKGFEEGFSADKGASGFGCRWSSHATLKVFTFSESPPEGGRYEAIEGARKLGFFRAR